MVCHHLFCTHYVNKKITTGDKFNNCDLGFTRGSSVRVARGGKNNMQFSIDHGVAILQSIDDPSGYYIFISRYMIYNKRNMHIKATIEVNKEEASELPPPPNAPTCAAFSVAQLLPL